MKRSAGKIINQRVFRWGGVAALFVGGFRLGWVARMYIAVNSGANIVVSDVMTVLAICIMALFYAYFPWKVWRSR